MGDILKTEKSATITLTQIFEKKFSLLSTSNTKSGPTSVYSYGVKLYLKCLPSSFKRALWQLLASGGRREKISPDSTANADVLVINNYINGRLTFLRNFQPHSTSLVGARIRFWGRNRDCRQSCEQSG